MSAARVDGEYWWLWPLVGRSVARWGRGDCDRLCICLRAGEGGVEEEELERG